MGLVALLGIRLEARLGERRGIALGLLLIALACLLRLLLDQAATLLATALLGGVGVALIQALVPALIKRRFAGRVALAMGVYSASLMGGGGFAALLSPHLASHFSHWQAGLGVWLLPALAALMLWLCVPASGAHNASVATSDEALWRQRRAWMLALYFGLINCGYMSMVAWLPAYYLQLGWSATQSGSLLAFMTLFQVSAALLMPALAQRRLDRRPLLGISLVAQVLGFTGLVLWPLDAPHVWVALIGFGLGACFALSLLLTLDHRRDPRQAGQLAAFVQGVGFLINAVSPWLSGCLRELTGSFTSAWWVLIVTVLAMLVLRKRPDVVVVRGERLPFWSAFGRVAPCGLGLTLASIGYGTLTTFVTLFYLERGWSGAALCLSAFGVCFILSRLLFVNAVSRWGGYRVAIACMGVEAVGLALLWLAPSPMVALLGAGLSGFGLSLVYPALGVEAIKQVPSASRGAGLGAYAVFFDLALAIAGPVMGAIAARLGYAWIFCVAALLSLLGVGLTLMLWRRTRTQ